MAATYLDASAMVKLAVREPESAALRRYLRRRRPWVSSALARTEVLRTLLPAGDGAQAAGRRVLGRCDLVRVSNTMLDLAGELVPAELRPLDAIHLATATRLGADLGVLVTYDRRMAEGAERLGLRVAGPS